MLLSFSRAVWCSHCNMGASLEVPWPAEPLQGCSLLALRYSEATFSWPGGGHVPGPLRQENILAPSFCQCCVRWSPKLYSLAPKELSEQIALFFFPDPMRDRPLLGDVLQSPRVHTCKASVLSLPSYPPNLFSQLKNGKRKCTRGTPAGACDSEPTASL